MPSFFLFLFFLFLFLFLYFLRRGQRTPVCSFLARETRSVLRHIAQLGVSL